MARPPAFTYHKAVLHCEGVSLARLAERFGTPLYVYSASTIRHRARAFDRAFSAVPHSLCYSVKANPNLSILRLLHRLGAGFDVVSGGELERVLTVSRRAAARAVFSGVGKTAAEMDAALQAGILMFNVESESELLLLAARAAHARKAVRVALRINPDVPAETHPYISTGLREHKFGVPMAEARTLYARAAQEKFLQVTGVSVHIGSQITSMEPFAASMERVAELVRRLDSDGHRIRYVDAGGGLGVPYDADPQHDFSATLSDYARAILRPLKGLRVHLLLEPGRAVVAPAGALLTRILYAKHGDSKRFLVVDAAMNDLLRPCLYGAYHEIVPAARNRGPVRKETFDIVGPVCETGDFLARDRQMPPVVEGDLLAVLDVGAYGMSLASNYNSRPRPAEVLVNGRSARLIRRRESMADLLRNEKL